MTENKTRKTKSEHKPGEQRFMRGGREQISLTLPAGTTDRVDVVAAGMGLTRAGALNLAISNFLKERENDQI